MPKTILLADDSSTIRKIVELTFNGTDIRVEAFENGEAAMEHWEAISPDLILADVVMPGPTGYELCKRVKASEHAIPVLLLSSSFEPFDQELAEACGADGHLTKPFESGTLTETVRELLEGASPSVAEIEPETDAAAEAEEAVEALVEDEPPAVDEAEVTPSFSTEELDERLVDAVSRAVVHRLSEQVVREIAREVVPDLAERIIRERIRQLENEDS